MVFTVQLLITLGCNFFVTRKVAFSPIDFTVVRNSTDEILISDVNSDKTSLANIICA